MYVSTCRCLTAGLNYFYFGTCIGRQHARPLPEELDTCVPVARVPRALPGDAGSRIAAKGATRRDSITARAVRNVRAAFDVFLNTPAGGHRMKILLTGIAVAGLVMAAQPVWSQSSSQQLSQNTQDNAPGTGGTSKPGTPGKPGGKSGPAAKPSGAAGADESGVKGMPGNKSGPAVKEPGKNQ